MTPNPFIVKAENQKVRIERALATAMRHHFDLLALYRRYTDKDNQEARERIRLRVSEASECVEFFQKRLKLAGTPQK